MSYEALFLKALAVTIAVETAVLIFLIKVPFKNNFPPISTGRLVFAGIACSGATLPYLWFIVPWLIPVRTGVVVLGELFVIAAEAVFYQFILNTGIKKAVLLSVCCNLVSMGAGLLLF